MLMVTEAATMTTILVRRVTLLMMSMVMTIIHVMMIEMANLDHYGYRNGNMRSLILKTQCNIVNNKEHTHESCEAIQRNNLCNVETNRNPYCMTL